MLYELIKKLMFLKNKGKSQINFNSKMCHLLTFPLFKVKKILYFSNFTQSIIVKFYNFKIMSQTIYGENTTATRTFKIRKTKAKLLQ